MSGPVNDVEEAAEAVYIVQFARERCSEIEAETIDVHFSYQ